MSIWLALKYNRYRIEMHLMFLSITLLPRYFSILGIIPLWGQSSITSKINIKDYPITSWAKYLFIISCINTLRIIKKLYTLNRKELDNFLSSWNGKILKFLRLCSTMKSLRKDLFSNRWSHSMLNYQGLKLSWRDYSTTLSLLFLRFPTSSISSTEWITKRRNFTKKTKESMKCWCEECRSNWSLAEKATFLLMKY